jgi:hypothetical protein
LFAGLLIAFSTDGDPAFSRKTIALAVIANPQSGCNPPISTVLVGGIASAGLPPRNDGYGWSNFPPAPVTAVNQSIGSAVPADGLLRRDALSR